MKTSIILVLILCSFFSLHAVPEQQPTLAVLPFQISRVQETVQFGSDFSMSRNLVEKEFTNELMDFLAKSRKFNILDRTRIDKVVDENELTYSEWVRPGEAERIGKLLVADFLVTGTINRIEAVAIKQNIKITGETAPRIVATFKCQYQVIETKSGKIVLAGQVIKKLKSEDVRRQVPASERKDWTFADYKDMLFNQTAIEIGNEILAGIYPVKVAAVTGDTVVLNRGKGAGVKVGEKLKVINGGKTVTDPDTGEALGLEETEVGLIEVTNVDVKFSKGKIIIGSGKISQGDICRPLKKEHKEPEAAYPRVTPGW